MPTTTKQDQELREKVLSIQQTQDQLIIPKLAGIEENVQRLVDRDYLTKADAKSTYVTKEDFAFIKKIFYAVLTAIVLGFISLGFYFIQGRLQ